MFKTLENRNEEILLSLKKEIFAEDETTLLFTEEQIVNMGKKVSKIGQFKVVEIGFVNGVHEVFAAVDGNNFVISGFFDFYKDDFFFISNIFPKSLNGIHSLESVNLNIRLNREYSFNKEIKKEFNKKNVKTNKPFWCGYL